MMTARESTRSNRLLLLGLQNSSVILFVVIFILFGLLAPRFLQYQNFENILRNSSYIGILAVGMTFVLLTGGIDISIGSNMYLSAVIAGLLMRDYNVSLPVGLLVCLGVGFLFGAVNAFAITKLKIIPFVVTLSTMVAGRGLALVINESQAIDFPETISDMGAARLFNLVPVPILIFAFVVLIAYLLLKQTPLGRQIYAIGNDVEVAKKAGLNTDRTLAVVYIICGVLAALGGFVSVAQLGTINAGFGQGDEFDAIAAAVLGGTSMFGGSGSVFPGTVLGAVMIQMIQAGLVFLRVDLYIQPMIQAAIIFLAVFLDSIRDMQLKQLKRRNIRALTRQVSSAEAR